jgi:protein TonB
VLAYQAASTYVRSSPQRRASGFVLALGVNLLLLLALLTLGVLPKRLPMGGAPLVIDLIQASKESEETAVKSAKRQTNPQPKTASRPLPTPKPPPIILPVKPTIAPPPLPPSTEPPWIEMSKDEMASAEVSHLPKASNSASSGDSEAVGRGPNGEVLYLAEWVRLPTNTEIGGYVRANESNGFGEIACRTIPGNRVEDCLEMGQTPGSRLASALRQAAWQFHVRPPRKGGHAIIGAWVRIHLDYETIGRSSAL